MRNQYGQYFKLAFLEDAEMPAEARKLLDASATAHARLTNSAAVEREYMWVPFDRVKWNKVDALAVNAVAGIKYYLEPQ